MLKTNLFIICILLRIDEYILENIYICWDREKTRCCFRQFRLHDDLKKKNAKKRLNKRQKKRWNKRPKKRWKIEGKWCNKISNVNSFNKHRCEHKWKIISSRWLDPHTHTHTHIYTLCAVMPEYNINPAISIPCTFAYNSISKHIIIMTICVFGSLATS